MIKVTKKLSTVTVLALTICLLVGSVIAFAADNRVYKIRFAHGLPGTHYVAMEYADWGKMVNEESNGRLKVEMYPGGQLYNDKKLISAVRTGACEMGAIYPFAAGTIVPEFKAFTIPMVINGRENYIKVIEGDIGKYLFSKMEDKGIKPLGWIAWGIGGEEICIISTTSVHVPSDLKGKIIKAVSPEQIQYLKEYCGASSAYVAGGETYMALQRGTIDGVVASLTHLIDRKLSEVTPYAFVFPVSTFSSFLIINKQFYDKLPEDLQQVITDVSNKIQKKSYKKSAYIYRIYDLKCKEAVKGRGEIYRPGPEESALWTKDIEDFWKRVTAKEPEVYDLIMKIQKLKN